jgi:heme/copper-type cytochrome/quinol oxidase subunit 3
MALSVRASQTNQRKATVNWLIATIILGSVFAHTALKLRTSAS